MGTEKRHPQKKIQAGVSTDVDLETQREESLAKGSKAPQEAKQPVLPPNRQALQYPYLTRFLWAPQCLLSFLCGGDSLTDLCRC